MDRLCPKCGQRYRADVAICPVHRVALVEDPFIGRSLGEYGIVGYLGQGAMGVVYRADPPAAIKILNVVRARMQPELVRRFELEAKAIARLESPHVVRLYDAGTTGDGHLYITMELLRGQTLDDLIRARRKLKPARAADIAFQAASALAEAHDKWVVHRDVKPDNLYLEPAEGGRDFVRVLDFGVVRINSDSVARSITGTVAGTPAYMSPEQLKSEKDIDGRTDIYSLGVVLYLGLAGRNPFQGEGLMQTIQRHLYEPVPPLPEDVPPPLAALTLRMLAKAREDRPQTMADVQAALGALGLFDTPPVRLAGPVGVDLDPASRERTLAALETDPAFQRARQITPVARPVDPPSIDEPSEPHGPPTAPGDPFAPLGGSYIESALDPAPRRTDPWRSSAPPADRPSIDIPAARLPTDAPGPVGPPGALGGGPTLDGRPDPPPVQQTWVEPDLDALDVDDPAPGRHRRRLVFTALIFALGAVTGVGLSAGLLDDPRPTVEASASPPTHRLRREIRAAMEREDWAAALAGAERLIGLRPDDPRAAELRREAAAEAAAAETWDELLDRIADEQWQAAHARAASFPPGSVYTPRVEALAGLIEDGIAAARLEDGLSHALADEWAEARAIHDALAALERPPRRLPVLDAALRRKRFKPTPYTEHLLEARARLNAGDYRLALTRLQQAAGDIGGPDLRISRRMCSALRALGEFDAALAHARRWRALEEDPRYAPVIARTLSTLEARSLR